MRCAFKLKPLCGFGSIRMFFGGAALCSALLLYVTPVCAARGLDFSVEADGPASQAREGLGAEMDQQAGRSAEVSARNFFARGADLADTAAEHGLGPAPAAAHSFTGSYLRSALFEYDLAGVGDPARQAFQASLNLSDAGTASFPVTSVLSIGRFETRFVSQSSTNKEDEPLSSSGGGFFETFETFSGHVGVSGEYQPIENQMVFTKVMHNYISFQEDLAIPEPTPLCLMVVFAAPGSVWWLRAFFLRPIPVLFKNRRWIRTRV